MKILIFLSLFSLSAHSAYNKAKLGQELLDIKKSLYQDPELQKALKDAESSDSKNDASTTITKDMTLSDLKDLEEIYFDKVSTKKSGIRKRPAPKKPTKRER